MCYSIMVENDLATLRKLFDLKNPLSAQPLTNPFKAPSKEGRIYPLYGAPVLGLAGESYELKYMRYSAYAPAYIEPTKAARLSTFNARLERLKAPFWQEALNGPHGLVAIRAFYEWVLAESPSGPKKKVIKFLPPAGQSHLLVPAITSPNPLNHEEWGFAVITAEPRPEVLAQGHDRSPLILSKENAKLWLSGEKRSLAALKTETDLILEWEWA